jgi:hypothetical protein
MVSLGERSLHQINLPHTSPIERRGRFKNVYHIRANDEMKN